MPTFTFITHVRGIFHLSQHETARPETGLTLHLGSLPFEDGQDVDEDELAWLQRIVNGAPVFLVEVAGCPRTWLWKEGTEASPQYVTYLVQTDAPRE